MKKITGHKRGPKLIQLDWEEFDKLCAMQATLEEIASWFDCSADTIERAVKRDQGMKFAEYFAQKSGKGKISLRRVQWQLALKGNVAMVIFLGKNYLGQSDKIEQKQTIEVEQDFLIGFADDENKYNPST